MPIYTGRTRTLQWSGVAEGVVSITHECLDGEEIPWQLTDSGTGNVTIDGLLGKPTGLPTRIRVLAGISSSQPETCDSPSRTAAHDYQFDVATGLGDTDGDLFGLSWTGGDADGTKTSSWEVEWEIECTVREREYIYDLADQDADGFPGLAVLDGTNRVTGYSAGPKDHLHGRGIYWVEEITPSTTVTVTAICKVDGSTVASLSASDTVTGAGVWEILYPLVMTAEASGNSSLYGTTAEFQGVSLDGSGTTYNRSNSWGSVSSTGGPWVQATGGLVSAIVEIYPQIDYDCAGIIRKFSTNYDGSVTVQIDGRNGEPVFEDDSSASWSRTWAQKTYNYQSYLGPGFATVFEQGPAQDHRTTVRAWLSSASLSAAGEEPTDQRLLFRGRRWDALSVALAAAYDFDTGDPANWTAAANGTLSGTTEVKVTASGGESGMARAFSTPAQPEAYRYLRLRVRASAAMTLRLSLEGRERVKKYRFDAGTSWANVDIDMMIPRNAAGRVHEEDSRWPVKPPGDADEFAPIDEGWLFGINWLKSLEIEGVPDGEWLEVDFVQGVRSGTPALSFLPEFNNPVTRWVDGSTTTADYRFVYANADGKLSLDWFGLTRVSGMTTSYSLLPIGTGSLNLAGYIAGVPGWSCSTTAGPDAHNGLNDPAFWAGGSGATYDWSGDTWALWIDIDPRTAITVPAQALWDVVQVYPGAGDVWTSGTYGVATKLRAAKHLRGRAYGIVAERGAPLATQTVKLQEPTWTDADTETTAANGTYVTGTVHGDSALAHRVLWNDGSADRLREWVAAQWVARRWHGASFQLIPPHGGLSAYDVHPSGLHGRAILNQDTGTIEFGTAENTDGATFTALDTGLSGLAVAFRWHIIENRPFALLFVLDGENGAIYTSEDLGASWTMATTFSTITEPLGAALCVHPDGRVCAYWLDGTTVKGAVLDSALTTLRTSSSIRTGVDPGGVSAAAFQRRTTPRTAMLTVESGTPTITESTDGLAFS